MCPAEQGNTPLPKGSLAKHYSEGVLFVTYSLLVSNTKQMTEPKLPGTGEAAAAEPQDWRIPKGTRLQQIVDWLDGGEGDPLIVRPGPTSWSASVFLCALRHPLLHPG